MTADALVSVPHNNDDDGSGGAAVPTFLREEEGPEPGPGVPGAPDSGMWGRLKIAHNMFVCVRGGNEDARLNTNLSIRASSSISIQECVCVSL